MTYTVIPLDESSWEGFAELVDRNNGIFGGCWCIAFHEIGNDYGPSYRKAKEDRVRSGRAHAALVRDESGAVQGWCQFGSPDELPGIKNRVKYEQGPPPTPDFRLACVFVDKRHRKQGIARAAVEGALDLIGRAGGGLVEAISEVTDGRVAQDRFLFTATAELFEDLGFERVRQIGKHAWILSRQVDAVAADG